VTDTRLKQIAALLDDARLLAADLIEDGHPDEFSLNFVRSKCNDAIAAVQRMQGRPA